jgi:ribonuclease HI
VPSKRDRPLPAWQAFKPDKSSNGSDPLPDTTIQLKAVTIWTDGACTGNPGPGGYGVVLLYGEKRREISAGYRRTTNNRMEIMAVIAGLEALRYRCAVTVYTDSQYVANSITRGWARGWRAKAWVRDGKPVPNADLWKRMLELCAQHEVKFEWVKGHAGTAENERCDRLSVEAARGKDLPADTGYERPSCPAGNNLLEID